MKDIMTAAKMQGRDSSIRYRTHAGVSGYAYCGKTLRYANVSYSFSRNFGAAGTFVQMEDMDSGDYYWVIADQLEVIPKTCPTCGHELED